MHHFFLHNKLHCHCIWCIRRGALNVGLMNTMHGTYKIKLMGVVKVILVATQNPKLPLLVLEHFIQKSATQYVIIQNETYSVIHPSLTSHNTVMM